MKYKVMNNNYNNNVECWQCQYLMFSDCYGECSKENISGIVQPHFSCGKGEYMLTSLKIKKYLRSANKTIRELNDGILHDDLWRGRFYARQKKYWKQEYEDKSGLQVIFLYEFVDLKTGQTKEYWLDNLDLEYNGPFKFHVWKKMNDFIVEECDVWRKEGRDMLYSDKTVYRNQ